MNEIKTSNSHTIDFLKHEYDFTADYLKFSYNERDRYIKFYMGALTAISAVIGYAIGNEFWTGIYILTTLTAIFSLFVFIKTLNKRIVNVEYKTHLNLLRGKILELSLEAKEANEVKSIILSTSPIKYFRGWRGDSSILRVIALVAAFSTAGIFMFFYYPKWKCDFDSIFLKFSRWGPILIFLVVIFLLLELVMQIILRKKDRE